MDPQLQNDIPELPIEQDTQQDHQQGQYQHSSSAELAPQACQSCRKQKRKCDKRLPSCRLCERIGRPCVYSQDVIPNAHAPSPEDFAALRQQVADLQNLIRNSTRVDSISDDAAPKPTNGVQNGVSTHATPTDSTISPSPRKGANLSVSAADNQQRRTQHQLSWPCRADFPPLFFLDSNAFEYERYQIHAPHLNVPPGALSALGNSIELRAMIETYFDSVHTYFPIISKIRLYQHLANPLHEPGADIALLFLAMKLACSEIPEGHSPQTQLYQDVKSFYHYIEAQNGFSMQSLQALLLLCLYETGNAIYPAAYITIGHAARLAYAEGLHDRKAPQMIPRCLTWTEQEERRRVWWAVIILDRFVHIGHRGKPFATNDPSLDMHLPTDDCAWDRGQMLVAAPLALSASNTIRAAPYARTCQAAHLLGKVLRHLDDQNLPSEYRFEEALQLHRTMRALTDVLPAEVEGALADEPSGSFSGLGVCSSIAMCYSGLLTFYDSYMCTERAVQPGPEMQLVMQQEAINGLSEISEAVVRLARQVKTFVETAGLHRLSPLIIDCFYQAAANYAWYVRESSSPVCGEHLAELKSLLVLLDRRWKVAGAYLFILSDYWDNTSWYPNGKS